MIRALSSYFSFAKPMRDDAQCMTEVDYKLGNIDIVGSYYGYNNDASLYTVSAMTSNRIMAGDTLLMFVSSEMEMKRIDGFKVIMSASDKQGHMGMTLGYRVWQNGDQTSFGIPDYYGDVFVNLITLRGTRFIVDAKAMVSHSCSTDNAIIAPRVETKEGGCLINAFSYDEPYSIHIPGSKNIASIENGHKGLYVGALPSLGGTSKRTRAFPKFGKCGLGDDIAMSVSII